MKRKWKDYSLYCSYAGGKARFWTVFIKNVGFTHIYKTGKDAKKAIMDMADANLLVRLTDVD